MDSNPLECQLASDITRKKEECNKGFACNDCIWPKYLPGILGKSNVPLNPIFVPRSSEYEPAEVRFCTKRLPKSKMELTHPDFNSRHIAMIVKLGKLKLNPLHIYSNGLQEVLNSLGINSEIKMVGPLAQERLDNIVL